MEKALVQDVYTKHVSSAYAMTENDIKSSKALEQELESLREKIAHIQSFVQQSEKESLLKSGKEPPSAGKSDRFACFIEEGPLGNRCPPLPHQLGHPR